MYEPRLPGFIISNVDLRGCVTTTVKKFINGRTPEAVQQRLDGIFSQIIGYDDVYEDLYRVIKAQGFEKRSLAENVLLWLSYTQSPLLLTDMQHILDTQPSGDPGRKLELDADQVVSACAGLVTANEETGVIRFIHETTRAYFTKRKLQLFPTGEDKIAKMCLGWAEETFTSDDVSTLPTRTRCEHISVHDYAIHNWGCHINRSNIDGTEPVIRFLDNDKVMLKYSPHIISSNDYPEYSQLPLSQMTKLHVASFFGLTRTIKALLQKLDPWYHIIGSFLPWTSHPIDTRDGFGRTPLSFAAEKGHSSIVCMLLGHGAQVDRQDHNGRTPLMWASRGGHNETVETLLENGVHINLRDRAGRTALSWAAANGHHKVMGQLSAHGAILSISAGSYDWILTPLTQLFQEKVRQDVIDETMSGSPLIRASCNDHLAVVEMLVSAGTSPDQKDEDGRTALSWAAANGHRSMVKFLLASHADPDTIDCNGQTALSWAIRNGHIAIVEMLLCKGSSMKIEDNAGMMAPVWAAFNGQKAILQLLLKYHADLRSRDKNGMSALLWASANGHRATSAWLLSREEDPSLPDSDCDGRTALSWAAGTGDYVMVKFLLDTVGDPLLKKSDNTRRNALGWAAANGHPKVIQLLISQDRYDLLSNQDMNDMTALSWACVNGHEAAAKEILASDRSATILECRDNAGRTPLMLATRSGHRNLVQLLLRNSADVEARDSFGDTALSSSAADGSAAIVKVLLRHGANPNSCLRDGWTPLMFAVRGRHHDVVRMIMHFGGDINATDDTGQTCLILAVKNEDRKMVELLLDMGADVEVWDKSGATPISLAMGLGKRGRLVLSALELKDPFYSSDDDDD
ncbi:hypothetical protein FE257_004579 [Aspergillus nanangensis]|uniref:Uncharacterized protein n=1 Tax=Aspergillus nanangensis TaxID=2582783 RepID=A0AAD4GZD3_ASPNN|nr:hypothetical protein FE257_004579 [Aspergillus nanangensis]